MKGRERGRDIRSAVVLGEGIDPSRAVVGHAVGDDDAEPVEDGLGLHVLVQRHVEHAVRGLCHYQAPGEET